MSEHSTTDVLPGDGAMARKLFIEMTDNEQDAYITQMRERRLVSVNKHKELALIKQRAKDERTIAMITKEGAMMEKEMLALEKALAKVENRANRISALSAIVKAEADDD